MNELCATKDDLEQCEETETWLTDVLEECQGGLTNFRAGPEVWWRRQRPDGGRAPRVLVPRVPLTTSGMVVSHQMNVRNGRCELSVPRITSSLKIKWVFEFSFSGLCGSGCVWLNGLQVGFIKDPWKEPLFLKFEANCCDSFARGIHNRKWGNKQTLIFKAAGTDSLWLSHLLYRTMCM